MNRRNPQPLTPAQYAQALDNQQVRERYAEALRPQVFPLTPGTRNHEAEQEAREVLTREMIYRGLLPAQS